jgi:hypothetical protein
VHARIASFSAAPAGGEPDLVALDVVDDAERLLLRVPDDGGAPGGRERQARRGAVHVHEQVPRGQLQDRAAGEGHVDRRRAHLRGLALEARVEDGEGRRAGRPLHGRRHGLAQRRVHPRGQARDHRAGVDDRRQARVGRRRHGERPARDGDPGQLDEVERVVQRARCHGRVRVLPRVVGADGQVPGRRRRRQAVGEGVAQARRELVQQRQLVARQADEPRRVPEEPLVVLAAPVVEVGHAAGAQGHGLLAQVPDGEGAVAVAGLVDADVGFGAGGGVERGGGEVAALRLRAGDGGVGAGRLGVEHGAGLAVARHHAGGALEPRERGARVHDHHVRLGRRAEAHAGDVVAHAHRGARAQRHGREGLVGRRGRRRLVQRGGPRGRRLGEARGERCDARVVVGEHRGEGEVGGQRRRRAGAPRVVQREVEPGAVQVREVCSCK